MTYKLGEKKDGKLVVEFKLDGKEWEAEVEKAYQKNKGKYKLDGFRQGKIPRKVLENTYGDYLFYEDALNIACDRCFFEMLEKEQTIQAVDYPDISVKSISKDGVEFAATITLMPEVELGALEGLEVSKSKVTVSEKEVDERIKQLQEKQARFVDVTDRAAKLGDLVNIDYEGSIDGVKFDGGSAKDFEIELGTKTFIDTFEDQIAGMKIDEEKDINVTFPKEYGAANLAGKPAVFKTKLLAIREKQMPEIDDKFAADVSEFETLVELKKDTKEKIKADKESAAERELQNALVDAVVAKSKCDIPEVMVANQINRGIEDMKRNLAAQGLNYEMYLSYLGMDDAKFRATQSVEVEKQIKTSLVLGEIIKQEKLVVTDEEFDAKVAELAEKMKKSEKELKKTMNPSQKEVIENNIISEKVIKLLKEKNNIK